MLETIIVGGVLSYLLLTPSTKKVAKSTTKPKLLTMFYPPVPSPIIRNDVWGKGHFGASRSGGKRRHNGIDLIVYEGQEIRSAIRGYMKRMAYPYPSDLRWKGLLIKGLEEFSDLEIKIFYFSPYYKKRRVINKGDVIGVAQAINKKYDSRMINHIHFEVRKNGRLVDPAPYLFVNL